MQTEVVGIVNVTPDSFSDGGDAFAPEVALEKVRQCFADGAAVADIGAQSTRPGAASLSAAEEWERLREMLPEAVKLAKSKEKKISVDTFHPEVAEKALAEGVDWINDVAGFENPTMRDVVRGSNGSLVLMHSLGVPPSADVTLAVDSDPVAQLAEYFRARLEVMEKAGISPERLILDPGIGFGKTPLQSLALCLRARELTALGVPLLYGHSRKSFLSLFTSVPPEERDDLTLAVSSFLASAGVRFVRVHNVSRHVALFAKNGANLSHN